MELSKHAHFFAGFEERMDGIVGEAEVLASNAVRLRDAAKSPADLNEQAVLDHLTDLEGAAADLVHLIQTERARYGG